MGFCDSCLQRKDTFSISLVEQLALPSSFGGLEISGDRALARLFLHQKPPGCRDTDRVCSIRCAELQQNILHVGLYGCL